MHQLFQNVRFSLRMLGRKPGLTLTVLLTLALGIGANTAIFTVDYATLLAPLPYPEPNQLVVVWSRVHGFRNVISAGDYLDWKRENKVFQDLNAWWSDSFNVATREQPEILPGRSTTPGFYRMLGYAFFLGRDFLPEEGEPGKDRVVILTHKFWMRLGSDPNILGTTIPINGVPHTVVGVLAPGLTDRGQGEIVVPLAFRPDQITHDFHWILAMGRLKPGVTLKQAQDDMEAVASHIAEQYPKSNKGWGVRVEPLKNDFIPPERIKELWLLLGAVGFVLLIACVNVANLLLARGMARQKELAVRSAMGAQRTSIFAQLITESLILAIAGGILGVFTGYAILQGLIAVTPPNTLPSEADLTLNIPILLFTLAATTLAGLLFGCAPAWYASRVDPGEALKEGGRSGVAAGSHRLRRALVVGEFALALTLLAGAGLTIHSFWKLMRVDIGVRTDHILTFGLNVPDSRPKAPEQLTAYYRQMLGTIAAVPGVSSVSAQTGTPLDGMYFTMPFTIAGQPEPAERAQRASAGFWMVTPEFFRTFGIRSMQGRMISEQDGPSSVRVAVVNEDFVRHYLKGSDPLHQRVVIEEMTPGSARLGPSVDWEIVGVVHNVRDNGFRDDEPEIYVPFWQSPWTSANIGVLTGQDPASMLKSVAAAVHSVDPSIALGNPRTMEQVRDDVLAQDRFTAILFASFAVIALLLAALGIYGVMAFSVAQRSREIALRMALGSDRSRVISLVLREGALLALIGMGVGLVGAYFVGRALQSALYGVGAMDFAAFVIVATVLLLAAVVACFVPARRASSLDPMQVLRTE